MTRRKASITLAATVALLTLTACGATGQSPTPAQSSGASASSAASSAPAGPAAEIASKLKAEGGEVTLYWPANANFAAFIAEDLVPGFKKHIKTTYDVDIDVKVLETAGGDGAFLDRLEANGTNAGFAIDVSRTAPSPRLLTAVENGLLAPLSDHKDLLGNLDKLDPKGTATFEDGGKIYGAPIYRPTMSLFYNNTTVTDVPKSFADMLAWAEANPGKFTYEDPRSSTGTGSGTMFLVAVQHAYGDEVKPDTWTPGWDYLKKLQAVSAPQPQAGDQLVDLFARGEVTMMPYWNDAGLFAKEDLNITEMSNTLLDEGFPIRFTPFVVPAGAANPVGAMLLTDYMIGAEMQTRVAERMKQIPATTDPAVAASFTDDTFGFPLKRIEETSFAAYNSKEALAMTGELTKAFETEVIGR